MLLDPDPEQHSLYEFGSRSKSQMSADPDRHDWFFYCLLAVNFSCKNSTFCETDQENLFYSVPFCRSLGCPGPRWCQSHTGSVLIPNIDDLLYCRHLFFTTTHRRFVRRIRESRAVETNFLFSTGDFSTNPDLRIPQTNGSGFRSGSATLRNLFCGYVIATNIGCAIEV